MVHMHVCERTVTREFWRFDQGFLPSPCGHHRNHWHGHRNAYATMAPHLYLNAHAYMYRYLYQKYKFQSLTLSRLTSCRKELSARFGDRAKGRHPDRPLQRPQAAECVHTREPHAVMKCELLALHIMHAFSVLTHRKHLVCRAASGTKTNPDKEGGARSPRQDKIECVSQFPYGMNATALGNRIIAAVAV